MSARHWIQRLPAHVVNGIGVALGIAAVQAVAGAGGGVPAALAALSGAVFASLADLPQVPQRTWRRVGVGALVGLVTTAIVTATRGSPVALGIATGALGFVSALALAWGLRAGPISFVAVLALVFTMAAPPAHGLAATAAHLGWVALGGALYIGWAYAASHALQRHYRRLALAAAFEASADLLRSRRVLLEEDPRAPRSTPPLQDWIQRQATLDERMQSARDLLFLAADQPGVARQIALLLLLIDLRDTLLASELDLDLLGQDVVSLQLRTALAGNLGSLGEALEAIARALREDGVPSPDDAEGAAGSSVVPAPPGSAQARLVAALAGRAQQMRDDIARMHALFRDEPVPSPLSPAQLQLFVSPDGWPLAALKPHATLRSPVLRHAIRSAIALACAYFIGLALPWASHPHWLVLSVAVVLRGNLEQTLARRNARVVGTAIGCLLVVVIAQVDARWFSGLAFLVAAGTAHSFVIARYLVTSAAASVMALLQGHMVDPAGGFGIGERLADTLLGAGLAWGFSYVLPWWERRSLPGLVARVLGSLRALAHQALLWPDGGSADLALRLARREVYDTIGMVAATAQRTGVEPQKVRLPLYALATLLTRCHVLLAQLAAVRILLVRRGKVLDHQTADPVLRAADAKLQALLSGRVQPAAAETSPGLQAMPQEPPTDAALLPWLERRLGLAIVAAAQVAEAAHAAEALSRR